MGFFRADQERARLKALEDTFDTAEKLGADECQKCGFCCHRRTCIPTPCELTEISKFLSLTAKETINTYFCIDRASFSDIYYVKPAGINTKDLVGKFIPTNRTYNEGQCIFLTEDSLCKIYSVKPESAKMQNCWEPPISLKDHNYGWTDGLLEDIIGHDAGEFDDDDDDDDEW